MFGQTYKARASMYNLQKYESKAIITPRLGNKHLDYVSDQKIPGIFYAFKSQYGFWAANNGTYGTFAAVLLISKSCN